MDISLCIGDLVIISYFAVFAFSGLVAIACLLAGPRARRLCKITTRFTGLFLVITGVWFTYIVISSGWNSEEGQFTFSLFFWAFLPVLGEFLVLLAICRWRMGVPLPSQ